VTTVEPKLVLVHPIANDVACWDFLRLPEAYPVEFPGHGDRERRAGWTQEEFADEVAASFEGPLDLVGLSMGATVVLKIVLRHPDRVRSAVAGCNGSVSRVAGAPEASEARRRQILARGERALGEEGVAAVLDETLTRWFSPFAIRTDHPGVRYARETILRMEPEAMYDVWACSANAEPFEEDSLAAIDTPMTMIGGLQDNSGLAGLAKLHGLVERSRYEILAGPHMMHLEQPGSFRAALDRHFAWLEAGAPRVDAPIASFASPHIREVAA
jgi:pimeloyl-ACP methyl ester carboxylesterase